MRAFEIASDEKTSGSIEFFSLAQDRAPQAFLNLMVWVEYGLYYPVKPFCGRVSQTSLIFCSVSTFNDLREFEKAKSALADQNAASRAHFVAVCVGGQISPLVLHLRKQGVLVLLPDRQSNAQMRARIEARIRLLELALVFETAPSLESLKEAYGPYSFFEQRWEATLHLRKEDWIFPPGNFAQCYRKAKGALWVLELFGPPGTEGKWERSGSGWWRWRGLHERDGVWYFFGLEPRLEMERWLFVGTEPELVFLEKSRLRQVKFKITDDQALLLSENSARGERHWVSRFFPTTEQRFRGNQRFKTIDDPTRVVEILEASKSAQAQVLLWPRGKVGMGFFSLQEVETSGAPGSLSFVVRGERLDLFSDCLLRSATASFGGGDPSLNLLGGIKTPEGWVFFNVEHVELWGGAGELRVSISPLLHHVQRRVALRVPLRNSDAVGCKVLGARVQCVSLSRSGLGGILLHPEVVLSKGQRVPFDLELGGHLIQGMGEVRRVSGAAFGLAFCGLTAGSGAGMTANDQTALRLFLFGILSG